MEGGHRVGRERAKSIARVARRRKNRSRMELGNVWGGEEGKRKKKRRSSARPAIRRREWRRPNRSTIVERVSEWKDPKNGPNDLWPSIP